MIVKKLVQLFIHAGIVKPRNALEKCPTCRDSIITRVDNYSFIETIMADKVHEKMKDVRDPNFYYLCSSCQEKVIGKDYHVCITCAIEGEFLKVSTVSRKMREREVFALSMCSNCIVPLHCYQGHKIVAMFPLLESLTQIKEWCKARVGEDSIADWEQIQLEPLVESDDEDDDEDNDEDDDDEDNDDDDYSNNEIPDIRTTSALARRNLNILSGGRLFSRGVVFNYFLPGDEVFRF